MEKGRISLENTLFHEFRVNENTVVRPTESLQSSIYYMIPM